MTGERLQLVADVRLGLLYGLMVLGSFLVAWGVLEAAAWGVRWARWWWRVRELRRRVLGAARREPQRLHYCEGLGCVMLGTVEDCRYCGGQVRSIEVRRSK